MKTMEAMIDDCVIAKLAWMISGGPAGPTYSEAKLDLEKKLFSVASAIFAELREDLGDEDLIDALSRRFDSATKEINSKVRTRLWEKMQGA